MKKLVVSLLTLMLTVVAFAQNNQTAQAATDEIIKTYQLDAGQAEQTLVVQKRMERNLKEIEPLKESDAKMYRHKKRSIQQGTDASMRRIFSEEQMKIYQQKRLEWRKDRAKRIAELKETGISMEEIEDVLLDEGY